MGDISFIDTTLRDGDQSLWGYRLTTGMILPVAERLDQAGFEAIECDVWTAFKIRVREIREEPWDRIRLLSKRITRTPLSVMAGVGGGRFDMVPLAFNKLRLERMAANGIRRIQTHGFLNDMTFRVPQVLQAARVAGLQVVLGLVYTISPIHTDDYYGEKTREAVRLKPDRIYLKDPGGLLTPERTRTIIPAIQKNSGGLPIEFHSHCTTGLAPLCYLEAMKLGIPILHTGIPPLANGPAQPSALNIAGNARLLGYTPKIDEEIVKQIARHFGFIARREGLPLGTPVEYDYEQYLHQVPGGVISNLKRQLVKMKAGHRLAEVLEESVQVRRDLGYPIMVTPFSQHVVTQATINVMLGERYQEVTDEVIQFCLGYWGKDASSKVVADVRARILDRARGRELERQEPYEPSLEEIRQKFGAPGISDDELLLRYTMGGDEELRAMRPAPPIREYLSSRMPLVALIEEATKKKHLHYFRVAKTGFVLNLEQRLKQND